MPDTQLPGLPGLAARRAMPTAVLLGLLTGLGQMPVSLPWASLIGLGLVFWLYMRSERPKGAGWIGWAFGAGYFAATLFWIVEPFFVDIARHGWMAPFALVGISCGMAVFWGVGFGVARWLGQGRWARALAWVVCLSVAELARSHVLTGFPWALIGHVWIGWAPMQLAVWAGPVGLTVLTLLLPGLVVTFWRTHRRYAGLAMIPFAGLYGLGMWQATLPVPETGRAPVLRLIQPNAAQHLKWDPDMALQFFARQIEFTAAPADPRPDLIIWPETAVPTWLDNAGPAFARISDAAGNTPVVLGIQRQDAFRAFNSLVVLDGAGQVTDLYDKHHLVPFGEYLPFGSLLNGLGLSAFTAQGGFGYSAGPGARVLDLGGLGKALPLICYEAIFPQDVRAAPERPDWLLQITNDAWFGRLSGPYQHLAQARLRAVEQGLPMVRVANTGVSAVIDARGRVLDALPLNEAGFLDARLPPPLPATVYARLGDAPVAGFLGLGLLILAGIRRRKRH